MVKTLRSLIHEYFPMELRVKIELLSRRRDIVNVEKQEELFKLLQEYKIEGIVPLGAGTNRYAFKLNGFVVKVATDHDGKIDNLKEFKMAKRLYPHVTKTYEVSENGTLLVAEYIQPFGSYTEMLKYADKIREILTKLSSVYLIGDVGITPKNYANWGLRIGSEEPVCLDFAYVYEVSSELFLCRECKTGTMLLPNKDFTGLYCPAPGCGKKYRFEDIRMKIGNDLHRHEIGDLTEEGYLLTESHVSTELTPSRSNYLERKKGKVPAKTTSNVVDEPLPEDNFMLEHEPAYYNNNLEEDTKMSENTINTLARSMANDDAFKGTVVRGRCVIRKESLIINEGPNDVDDNISVEPSVEPAPAADSGLAFSGTMVDTDDGIPAVYGRIVIHSYGDEDESAKVVQSPVEKEDLGQKPAVLTGKMVIAEREDFDPTEPVNASLVISDGDTAAETKETTETVECAKPDETVEATTVEEEPKEEKPIEENSAVRVELEATPEPTPVANSTPPERPFTDSFLNNGKHAVSKFSNRLKDFLHRADVFDDVDVRNAIHKKNELAGNFYTAVQNAIFRSLTEFCHYKEVECPSHKDPGTTHRDWALPDKMSGTPYEGTLVFLERFWNVYAVNKIEDPAESMKKYRELFGDFRGIQREWIPVFVKRFMYKYPIDKIGAQKVADIIADTWCVPEEPEIPSEPEVVEPAATVDESEVASAEAAQVPADAAVEENPKLYPISDEKIRRMMVAAADANPSLMEKDDNRPETEIAESSEEDESEATDAEVLFTAQMMDDALEAYRREYNEGYEECAEDAEEESEYSEEELMCVRIYQEDGFDIVKIQSGDPYGPINIPLYTHLDEINEDGVEYMPSLADDRNGMWDWLIHFAPDCIFRTNRPDYWLQQSAIATDGQITFVILDTDDDTGETIMGFYYHLGVSVMDDDGDFVDTDDESLLWKINNLIVSEIGNTCISHFRRTMAMPEMVHDDAYVEELLKDFLEDEDSEDDEHDDEDGVNAAADTSPSDAEEAAIAALMGEGYQAETEPDHAQKVTFKPIRRSDYISTEQPKTEGVNSDTPSSTNLPESN